MNSSFKEMFKISDDRGTDYSLIWENPRNKCFRWKNDFWVKIYKSKNKSMEEHHYSTIFKDSPISDMLMFPIEVGKDYIIYPYLTGYEQLDFERLQVRIYQKLKYFLYCQQCINISSEHYLYKILVNHTKSQIIEFKSNIDTLAAKIHFTSSTLQVFNRIMLWFENNCHYLAHGDFGHSNILVDYGTDDIKIVDYEFCMLAPKDFDYARLTVSEMLYRKGLFGDKEYAPYWFISFSESQKQLMCLHLVNAIVYKELFYDYKIIDILNSLLSQI